MYVFPVKKMKQGIKIEDTKLLLLAYDKIIWKFQKYLWSIQLNYHGKALEGKSVHRTQLYFCTLVKNTK